MRTDPYQERARQLATEAGLDPDARIDRPGQRPMPVWCTFRDAARKETDQMFKWLDTAYATRDSGLAQLAVEPFFRPYYNDPRFTALCQKLNVQVPSAPAKQ